MGILINPEQVGEVWYEATDGSFFLSNFFRTLGHELGHIFIQDQAIVPTHATGLNRYSDEAIWYENLMEQQRNPSAPGRVLDHSKYFAY